MEISSQKCLPCSSIQSAQIIKFQSECHGRTSSQQKAIKIISIIPKSSLPHLHPLSEDLRWMQLAEERVMVQETFQIRDTRREGSNRNFRRVQALVCSWLLIRLQNARSGFIVFDPAFEELLIIFCMLNGIHEALQFRAVEKGESFRLIEVYAGKSFHRIALFSLSLNHGALKRRFE